MNWPHSAISVVVADAGPLIALGKLDRLDLLPALFERVMVPHAVLAECLTQPGLPDSVRIGAALTEGWLLASDARVEDIAGLGVGERAAIGLARQMGAALLADDRAARACAV